MTRNWMCLALLIAAVAAAPAMPQAAAPEAERYEGPQWPNIIDDDVRRLHAPAIESSILPATKASAPLIDADPDVTGSTASWPNVPPDDLSFPATPSRPALRDAGLDVTGSTARWPSFAPEPQPSPFGFEAGVRYWYSYGTMSFAFSNGNPLFGTPTSVLDWRDLAGHTGEVFARFDHKPTGIFVKGVGGYGVIRDGQIDDRDYFVNQIKFSDTTSEVKGDNIKYASIDIGWGYSPIAGSRIGAFVGYQYWSEKATAYGLMCNPTIFISATCPASGFLSIPYDTAVGIYEPTWHALRIGFESKIAINDRWTASFEIAGIPFAKVENKDSHLLRQGLNDLGPAPNVIAKSLSGYGVQAEMFIDYALTPNIEIGGGLRYWQMVTNSGQVDFGPAFNTAFPLNRFDHYRYGAMFHVKGKF